MVKDQIEETGAISSAVFEDFMMNNSVKSEILWEMEQR